MTEQKLKLKIDPLGRPTVEADGFNGIGCEAATAGIEAALSSGDVKVSREIKDEWHQTEEAGVHQEQHW